MSLARNLSKLAQFLNGSGLLTSLGLAPDAVQVGMKNRIINGAMMIDQRNAGASVTPTSNGTYTLDRFAAYLSVASKYSVQQNAGSVTPPVGFRNYLGVTSLSAYTVGASEDFSIRHLIEGYNIADLAQGTASASSFTLSFQVYSSLTGTFGGSLLNNNGLSYPFSYTVSAANTWTTVNITISGSTSGTWNNTTSAGLVVVFSLGTGSTYRAAAGSWQSGVYLAPSSSVSVVGTNGATFYITGVQLEKGSTATSFDYRPYGTELALCQRYYWKNSGVAEVALGVGISTTTSTAGVFVPFPVTMRTSPTFGYSNIKITDAASYDANISSASTIYTGVNTCRIQVNTPATMVTYRTAMLAVQSVGSGYIDFSAEL